MKRRYLFGAGLAVLALLVTLVVWQGSFTFGDFGPETTEQLYLFWAMSTVVFLLTVMLAFILFRTGVKLYIERSQNKEGSRIKTKFVVGALVLSFLPVFFMVLWSVSVLNRNIDKWFSRPAQNIRISLVEVGESMTREARLRAGAVAHWLAGLQETEVLLATGTSDLKRGAEICRENAVEEATLVRNDGVRFPLCRPPAARKADGGKSYEAGAPVRQTGAFTGEVIVHAHMPADLEARQQQIQGWVGEYDQLAVNRRETRTFYLTYLLLITLFILFVATWIALFLARQVSVPISALLTAAGEVQRGNYSHRVNVTAIDELATLVRAFNEMMHELDHNTRELERRRRFTEAILESIPTGVISVASDGRIQRVNSALKQILGKDLVEAATRLDDLLPAEDAAEVRYMMKRTRRTGLASRQMELKAGKQTLHLSVTIAAIEERVTSGFVIVLEDTSELLRAQKAAAWHEVARRIAHEIKNPLTPISLSAERIARQLERGATSPEFLRIVRECVLTISHEVESVKTLVDEFSQLARFPAAQPQPSDLNELVDNALAVFSGRLENIRLEKKLAPNLPQVSVDREQFKRVVVNLVDNAAESMQDSPLRILYVGTQANGSDSVELVVSDTGSGISAEDKEKLFLPYFSTKGRGTGLGLAIVNHILADHKAHIRVEDNRPAGARFIVEIPIHATAESEPRPAEVRA